MEVGPPALSDVPIGQIAKAVPLAYSPRPIRNPAAQDR